MSLSGTGNVQSAKLETEKDVRYLSTISVVAAMGGRACVQGCTDHDPDHHQHHADAAFALALLSLSKLSPFFS